MPCRMVALIHLGKHRLTTTLASATLHALLRDLGGVGGTGGLGGRLLGLLVPLLRLGLGDGSLTSGGANLGLGRALGEDGSKVGADNTTLRSQSVFTCQSAPSFSQHHLRHPSRRRGSGPVEQRLNNPAPSFISSGTAKLRLRTHSSDRRPRPMTPT
jgi:hypothetical protein